jgi:YD repeat-containing protein
VTEMSTAAIRSIDNGVVSTLAGGMGEGLVDGDRLAARFNFLTGIAAGPDGSLYVADSPDRLIRRIDPAGVVTRITTGGVFPGNVAVSDGGSVFFTGPNSIVGRFVYELRAGAPVIAATASGDSTAMALDAAGNLYLSDNGQVTVTAPDGAKRTLASGVFALALAVDRAGLVHFISAGAIGTIDAQGRVTTRATTGGRDLALDGSGNVYFADGRLVRKLTADGVVTTIADLSSLEGVGNAQITGVALVGNALYATVRNAVVRVAPLN